MKYGLILESRIWDDLGSNKVQDDLCCQDPTTSALQGKLEPILAARFRGGPMEHLLYKAYVLYTVRSHNSAKELVP